MKKPNNKMLIAFIFIWVLGGYMLFTVAMVNKWIEIPKNIEVWKQFVVVFGGLILFILPPLFALSKAVKGKEKYSKWLWENCKDDIEKATIKLLRTKTLDDLLIDDGKKYTFQVTYKNKGTYETTLKAGDPDMELMISKLEGCPQVKDSHIKKTIIIAVNNQQITDTSQRISITGALLGGLIAGAPGAILGGMSGSRSYTYDKPGSNFYTFLIVFDDGRPNEVEKVQETSRRFKFLISKLTTD